MSGHRISRLFLKVGDTEIQAPTVEEARALAEISQMVPKRHKVKVGGASRDGYGDKSEGKAAWWALGIGGIGGCIWAIKNRKKIMRLIRIIRGLPSISDKENRHVEDAEYENVVELKQQEQQESQEAEAVSKPKTWYEKFHDRFIMPTNLPVPFIDIIMGVPDRHQDATLLQLLSMFGALISKVRAKYLDGKMHSPSLQVIIEGKSSSDKSVFSTIYQTLFRRLIERDNAKLNQGLEHKIVQNIGIGITKAKFNKALAGNHGVHMFMFDSEISNIARELKTSGGLTYEHLRYAFDNDPVYQNNMDNNAVAGYFKVYLNIFATGTPVDCEAFAKKQLTTGTIQRICYGVLPSPENDEDFTVSLPDGGRLNEIHDFIDDLCKMYCFTTDDQGNDHAEREVYINLDYVNDRIDEWIKQQKRQADEENNPTRRENCNRIGAMAFRAAMVLHILYFLDQSVAENEKQKSVRENAIYVANYCMERFLHKFQEELNRDSRENDRFEQATDANMDTEKSLEGDILALWDGGVKNQAEITRRLKDRYGDNIYPVKVGRILRDNNRVHT